MSATEKILTYDEHVLEEVGGEHTAEEINYQPDLWKEIWERINRQKDEIIRFLENATKRDNTQVILTGAGSSAFVGQVVENVFRSSTDCEVRAVPTTDLVTHFTKKVNTANPLLLISFGRSGNSPESTATVELAEEYCDTVFHLVITCNSDGKLANIVQDYSENRRYVFTLPPRAEDRALAMTGSFTGMVLTAALIARINTIEALQPHMESLVHAGQSLIDRYAAQLRKVTDRDFNRIVFLGSGALLGIANESHLKVQELTDGKVIGKFDSFLGFRHGPRAILNEDTLLIYLFSNDKHTQRYELDLANSIGENQGQVFTIGVSSGKIPAECKLPITLEDLTDDLPEEFLALVSVLPAQIIGLLKSIQLGLHPDAPSVNGSISRVVQGVKIYQDNM